MCVVYVAGVQSLQVSESPAAPAPMPQRRPINEYCMEPELQALCDRAAAAEQATGGKPKLHLAVVGHVDAGKSSLMGRLLHDLG